MIDPANKDSLLTPAGPESLNPDIKQGHDAAYADDQHGSTPMDTISVKSSGGLAIWPVIWAVVTAVLVAITLFLIFG